MHLIVPYAGALADGAQQTLAKLELPALAAFIARCDAPQRDDGDEASLSPPHERAHARALGWRAADGRFPWAAQAAQAAGIAPGDLAWGLLQPVHWRVGSDEVGLVDPAALNLGDDESRALFEIARPLVESEGFVLRWLDATRWLVAHESLRALATASIDRAIGRDVRHWLPRAARTWSRLHSELQMSWYAAPVNEARAARGEWPVNALWLSGCGTYQPARSGEQRVIDERLRAGALGGDWAGWAAAWRSLDAQRIAPLLGHPRPATLTLCGERSAATFVRAASGWWPRLRAGWRRASPAALLESL
jgi:hypothetical protein